jgi:hypothetical protein
MSSETEPDIEADEFDLAEDDELAETVVLPEDSSTDNVGDASVEINVEQLIADIEQSDDEVSARKKEVRRRLEELAENKSFEDTYAIEFDK